MAEARATSLACLLLGLISNMIACSQVNIAVLNVHSDYIRRRLNLVR